MNNMNSNLICPHCEGHVVWSDFFDDWYCPDCRTHDAEEQEEEAEE